MSPNRLAVVLLLAALRCHASASCISEQLISASDLHAAAEHISFSSLMDEVAEIAESAPSPYEQIDERSSALLTLKTALRDNVPFAAIQPFFDKTLQIEKKAELLPTERFDALTTLALIDSNSDESLSLLHEAEGIAWTYPSDNFADPHPESGPRSKGKDLGQLLSYYLLKQDLKGAEELAAKMRAAGLASFIDENALKRAAAFERLKQGDTSGFEALIEPLLKEEHLDFDSLSEFQLLLTVKLERKEDITTLIALLDRKAHEAILDSTGMIPSGTIVIGAAADLLIQFRREREARALMRDAETTPEPPAKAGGAAQAYRYIHRLIAVADWYTRHNEIGQARRVLAKARELVADHLDLNSDLGESATLDIALAFVKIGDNQMAEAAKSLSPWRELDSAAAIANKQVGDGDLVGACASANQLTADAAKSSTAKDASFSSFSPLSPTFRFLLSLARAQIRSGDNPAARESLAGAHTLALRSSERTDGVAEIAAVAFSLAPTIPPPAP